MLSKNENDVIDGWIIDATTRLDESSNKKIDLNLNQVVISGLLGVDLKDRPEYFLGARDTLVKIIQWRVQYSHPGYDVAWINESNAANDEPAGEGGLLVFTKKSDGQSKEEQPVTTEQVHKFLADWDENFQDIANANSMNDEEAEEEIERLKKHFGS